MPIIPNTTATAKTHPFTFVCDKFDCYWRTGHRTEQDALDMLAQHDRDGCQLPKRNYMLDTVDEKGQPYTALHYGKSIAEKLWDELDRALDQLKVATAECAQANANGPASTPEPAAISTLKGQCQGLAFAIQQMCYPYYPEVKDVTRQAVLRWNMRQGKMEFQRTPGYNYNPPPQGSKAYEQEVTRRKQQASGGAPSGNAGTTAKSGARAAGPSKIEKSFTEEQRAGIRTARDSGLLSIEQLATNFKVSVDFIKSL